MSDFKPDEEQFPSLDMLLEDHVQHRQKHDVPSKKRKFKASYDSISNGDFMAISHSSFYFNDNKATSHFQIIK